MSSESDEYAEKLIVFGLGFMPEASDAQGWLANKVLPESAPQVPKGMIPFSIDESINSDYAFVQYVNDLMLADDEEGCALNEGSFDFVMLHAGEKRCIVAWFTTDTPVHKYGYLKKCEDDPGSFAS